MRVPALRRAAVFLAVAACALPLTAAPAAADSPPAAFLTLVVQHLDGSGDQQVRTLECDPDGGTHPYPGFACDALRAADGDFAALPPLHDPCPPEDRPVRGIAVGHWNGRGVYHSLTAADPCALSGASGGVFPGR